MSEHRNDEPPNISQDELREIIRRAAELDFIHRDSLSEEDVRRIASDLGIGEAALVRALAEQRAGRQRWTIDQLLSEYSDPLVKGISSGLVIGGAAGLVFTLMVVITVVFGSPVSIRTLGAVLLALPAILALYVGGQRKHLTFQLRSAGFWAGVVATLTFMWRDPVTSFIWPAVLLTGISSGLGGLIIWVRQKLGGPPPGQNRDSLEALNPATPGFTDTDDTDRIERRIGASEQSVESQADMLRPGPEFA